MIERYTRPEMGRIWSERHKIDLWLRVEIAVAEAWAKRGVVPEEAMAKIRRATCDLERMKEIERETDHDVIAFLRATGETVGDAARFIHLGLTSSDVIDTALALQTVEAIDHLLAGLDRLIEAVGKQAVKHRDTLMIGRTHGIHAEPITFGFKLAVWYDELRRNRARLEAARDDIRVGKISGAVGTHANVPPDVEEDVCALLGLRPAPVSTQIIQRDRHAHVITTLAILASSLDKFATEIRHLQRTEVGELEEPFDPGNMGSSAMPHKRNPHESERISGLARLVRGYAVTAMENIALWHERDISNSSAERVIFPDAFILLDYMVALMTEIVEDWVVYPERMRRNLEATHGAIYSQRALLALVEAGMDRQEAYRIVQRAGHTAWDTGTHMRDLLLQDDEVRARLTPEQIEAIFDPSYHTAHIDEAFRRLGLGTPAPAGTSQ
ncbi:adenylosuccinate lyase [Sphaerobacter thermophilus]|uniref:Adenylosuccinate lyase n=1 Tax=Sphaerobacter thermophilus (strain ATCC 49802 / DSM 20745 / KCCM 41009 / NCIMB 13125 / S 6022) TaxID=479434 RepID=D1C3B1_SPHTD|nr:adenylosuccinate lyase [Sphaerobacter thermophilus]ACZ38728.1 adenylosuccinate lyase [Sphaerobacter thermophilus DSM 20745]